MLPFPAAVIGRVRGHTRLSGASRADFDYNTASSILQEAVSVKTASAAPARYSKANFSVGSGLLIAVSQRISTAGLHGAEHLLLAVHALPNAHNAHLSAHPNQLPTTERLMLFETKLPMMPLPSFTGPYGTFANAGILECSASKPSGDRRKPRLLD